jgi:formiminotetrahydrofolate cyclodeaminase
MSTPSFADLTVREFLERLASDTPTPGGGTGAAVVGAVGAALVRMLAVLTVGKPKFASVEPLMQAVAASAGEAVEAFTQLADADARAYDAVSAAYRLPKGSDAEKTARKAAIQAAMRGACEVPLRVMEQCLEVIGLAKNAVLSGNPNAASDGAAGAEFARSALVVAAYNVRINLAALDEDRWSKDVRTRLDEMLYMGSTIATEIDSRVQDLWKPKGPGGPPPQA